jgi:hypothetical protein
MTLPRIPEPNTRTYQSEAEFLASKPSTGPHEVWIENQWLDLYYIDKGAPFTLVGFHSSLGDNMRLPMFSGVMLARHSGMNYIGISDPSMVMGRIQLAWYLGNKEIGQLRPRLTPMVQHLLGDTHPVLFGASGGGYAATYYAQGFPDCTVVAANPRLNMENKPAATVDLYAEVCHSASEKDAIEKVRSEYLVDDLGELYRDGLRFDLVLLQNQEDKAFLEGQAQPFLEKLGGDPRLTYVPLHNGVGHVEVPRETLLEVLLDVTGKSVRTHA